MIRPIPVSYEAGSITRSGSHEAFPGIFSKGGATKGSSVVTLAGAPVFGTLYQYCVELTNALNSQVSTQAGMFLYNRGPAASLADFITKFAAHLAKYADVEVTGTSATTLTLRSEFWGFTPSLTILTPAITASNVLTNAVAPSLLVPGDVAILNPTSMGFAALPFRTANITAASLYGVVLRELGVRANDGRDQVYNILVDGYVACQAGGTTAKTAATTTFTLFTDGARPGMIGFGGTSNGATGVLTVGVPNNSGAPLTPVNMARQLRPITADVLPGQTFELRVKAI